MDPRDASASKKWADWTVKTVKASAVLKYHQRWTPQPKSRNWDPIKAFSFMKSECCGWSERTHGPEHTSREKLWAMVIFFIFVHKNVYRIRLQKIKIGSLEGFEKKKAFSSLFLMRKRLCSGQKWVLRPYFPLIWGMFVLRSGLRFSFRALEVPEPRVRKRPY